ncbi:MAG: lytic murein transglycosylase, partial [Perlucidibaca sp.]
MPFQPSTLATTVAACLFLGACASQPPQSGATSPAARTPTPAAPESAPPSPEVMAAFRQCLDTLRPAALAAGLRADRYDALTSDLAPALDILPRLQRQPEFSMPIWDYLSGLVDDERVEQGQAQMRQHAGLLAAISQRYSVPAEAVVAVWGVESNFGQTQGSYPLRQSLATLSCMGRRQAFFRGEFFAALRLLQAGDSTPERLTGSWAGAFGQTQFMPSTFERLAVDFDGDGRRDVIDSTADALASTANFLRQAGWRSALPWGLEVRLPAGFDSQGESRRNKHALSSWQARGLRRADGSALLRAEQTTADGLRPDTLAGLLLPAGPQGPAFLVTRNFDAFYSYNAAESYGLAIAHLSDRLRGGGDFSTPWPTDDPGLSRAQRRELQTLLLRRGHDIGEVDGRLGERSRT